MIEGELSYPRTWVYSIIGTDEARIRAHVHVVLPDRPFLLAPANRSRTGRYVSLHLEVHVKTADDRDDIFRRLRDEDSIQMIL